MNSFPQEIQNNINMNNQINISQIIPIQNSSSVQRIILKKVEGQEQQSQTSINNIQNNNNSQIIKETKIITNTFEPQRFSFNGNLNLNGEEMKINDYNGYKQLIKKIATKLKKPVRPPTQGFFNFALQKGEYSLIIIRKIETKIKIKPLENLILFLLNFLK